MYKNCVGLLISVDHVVDRHSAVQITKAYSLKSKTCIIIYTNLLNATFYAVYTKNSIETRLSLACGKLSLAQHLTANARPPLTGPQLAHCWHAGVKLPCLCHHCSGTGMLAGIRRIYTHLSFLEVAYTHLQKVGARAYAHL